MEELEDLETLSKTELIRKITDANENLNQAGMIGKDLLQQRGVLMTELEEIRKMHSKYEQTIHELRGQLEMEIVKQKNLLEDADSYRVDYSKIQDENLELKEEKRKLEGYLKSLSQECAMKDEKLQIEIQNLKTLHEQETEELRSELNAVLERSGQKDSGLNCSESFSTANMANELADLRKAKEEVVTAYKECCTREKKLNVHLEETKEEVEGLRRELAAHISLLNHAQEQVETCRNERAVVESELEMLKAGSIQDGVRGNSLFSELEDRRIRAEQQLVRQQEKYRELEERYNAKIVELRAFKDEFMSRLTSMHRSGPSTDEMRLEEMISRVKELEAELSTLRSQKNLSERRRECDLKQQLELVSAFAPPGVLSSKESLGLSQYQEIVRMKSEKIEELSSTNQSLQKEVMFIRTHMREAFDKAVKLERELQAATTNGLKLKFLNEDLRQEIDFLRSKTFDPSKCDVHPYDKSMNSTRNQLSMSTRDSFFSTSKLIKDSPEPSDSKPADVSVTNPRDENRDKSQIMSVLKTVNLDTPPYQGKKKISLQKREADVSCQGDDENEDNCKSM